jgi:hypothetical protein
MMLAIHHAGNSGTQLSYTGGMSIKISAGGKN